MAGPCLNDTESVTLNRDTSGNIEADLLRNGGDASGIEVTPTGVRINEASGVIRTASGLAVATPLTRTGYVVGGATGDSFPGTVVGPGAYVQISSSWTLALQRPAPAAMYAEVMYGAQIAMAADDGFTVNPFQGWAVALERRIWVTASGASGAWFEAETQGCQGATSHRHSLRAFEDIQLADDVARTLEVRVTARGSVAENVIATFLGRRYTRIRYT